MINIYSDCFQKFNQCAFYWLFLDNCACYAHGRVDVKNFSQMQQELEAGKPFVTGFHSL
jgi:hypothetical protein